MIFMKTVKDILREDRISQENYDRLMEVFGNAKCKEISDVDYFSINDASHYAFSFIFQDGQEQIFNKKINPLKEAVFVSFYNMKQTSNVYMYIYQPKATDYVYTFNYSLDFLKNISEFFNVFSIKDGSPCEESFDSLSPKQEYLFISKEPIISENKPSHLMARYSPK